MQAMGKGEQAAEEREAEEVEAAQEQAV